MALVGANGSRYGLGPARSWSGVASIAGGYRREHLERTSARFNYYAGEATVTGETAKSGVPNGARHPVAWLPPRTAGGLSAYTGTDVTFTVGTATLAAGRNIDGTTTFTFSVPNAALELVVSAVGSATVTFTASGTLAGALSGAGTAAVTFTVSTATLGAIVDALGSSTVTFSGAATPSAIGHLEGDITPFTELSPQSLAAAVWSALAASNNVAGTMGEVLNAAGGAFSPTDVANAVWAALSRTLTGTVEANVVQVNDIAVNGSGTEGDPWGPA